MNRAARRIKHKLIEAPHVIPPIRGLVVSREHKKWTCSCKTGWFSLSKTKPKNAFAQHVSQMTGEVK